MKFIEYLPGRPALRDQVSRLAEQPASLILPVDVHRKRKGVTTRFSWFRTEEPQRQAVEHYIADCFLKSHGAVLTQFMPAILAVHCGDTLSGAVGLRHAGTEPLFLEHYLEGPVEAQLGQQLGHNPARSGCLEVGNLVSTRRGGSYLMFVILSEVLHRAGHSWLVFTATQQVRQLLSRMAASPVVLGSADPARLPDRGVSWGTYYHCRPMVMAIDLSEAHRRIHRNLLLTAMVRPYQRQIEDLAVRAREIL